MPPSAKWTAEQTPGLSGKIVIVTAANSGLGYEGAREAAGPGQDTSCWLPWKVRIAA